MTDNRILVSKVQTIISLLVDEEYATVAVMTQNKQLTEEEIRQAIATYGQTLTSPPDDLPTDLDLIEVEDSNPKKVCAVMSLWTAQKGQSDLSLELTFTEVSPGLWLTQIDGIHVM